MQNFKTIQTKLEEFIRKFYANELIKGTILFFSIGLLYFLLTLLIEHFLWLNPTARTILFWLFVVVEIVLFVSLITLPLSKLFKLSKGINYEEASCQIGNHLPNVNDKLLNVLQLKNNPIESELLIASIEQKSAELTPIPFRLAVNFKKNFKYLKYSAIPIIILLVSYATGKMNWFSDSYQRVINYQTAYEPPAPFNFYVINQPLEVLENKDFKLQVKAAGDVLPDKAHIHFNNETYFLQQSNIGEFEYVFSQPKNDITFTVFSNKVTSKPYTLKLVKVPTLLNFEMVLNYPSYTKKGNEILKSTGNATIPQGTIITWRLNTKSTDSAFIYAKDTIVFKPRKQNSFTASKSIFNSLDYSISISNKRLKDYENLAFNLNVIKDEHPEINLQMKRDSLDQQSLYFFGQVSDDYGLNKLQLVYYPSQNQSAIKTQEIPIKQSNIDKFVSAFPNNLNINEGVAYNLYFQVFDNDAINKYKSTKSKEFTYRKRTKDEEEQKLLNEQNETIKDLSKSLEKFKQNQKELEELSKTQKEKSELNFNDKKKLESFLKRQKQQEEMMKNFNKKLQENLENFQKEDAKEDLFKEDLKQRLKENENQLKQDEKLLKELEKLREKISKEEFSEKLDKLSKQAKNQKRSLQQMLELTKRYYVGKKLEKLQQKLQKLAEEQEALSKKPGEENTKEKQDELNKKFKDFQKEMDALEKDNKELKKLMEIPRNTFDEKEVKDEQQKASDELEKKQESEQGKQNNKNKKDAQKNQKNAAKKMKQMSMSMQSALQMQTMETMQEDAEMLRQILDNLLVFSFGQEALMNQFKSIEENHNKYASYLRQQSVLREHFEHIDDSLFALSLRQPKLSERINKEITDVFFNTDKTLDQLSQNRLFRGIASQQYTITAANNLADFLSNTFDNMQMQMSGMSGQGKPMPGQGQGTQLEDIILSQEELNKEMKKGVKGEKGKNGKKGQGDNGEDGNKQNNNEKLGNGEGSSEKQNQMLYEIYQRQQRLRQALEERIVKGGLKGNAGNLLKKMEDIELDLINKGFTNQTLQKMMQLKHQLLKLENATFQQGEDNKRESKTNTALYNNITNNQIPTAKQYFHNTEILNRQALPLQQVYKKKVQDYFKKQ